MKEKNSKQNYLSNYTRFKNKIGLINNSGNYFISSGEIILGWPYKDCILVGGQTKEDKKNQEIFYNEILDTDEIDRLLDEKVFTNFQKIDKNGICKPENFNRDVNDLITDNLIIKGNNLLALYSLKNQFAGKIKMIYIDPPYNTGNDSFQYNDNFNHSTWLVFMKNRLEVAKELLKNDGVIFVQCDDNEQAYLKVLMDEIFGRKNFKGCIALKTSTASGVNAINVKRGERLFKLKEYLLFYSKTDKFRFNPLLIKSKYNFNYKYELIKKGKNFKIRDLSKIFKTKEELEKYCLENNENIYSLEKNNKKAGEKIKQKIKESKIEKKVIEFINSNGKLNYIYDGGVFISLKERVVEENGKYYFGTLISDFWDDEIFQSNKSEGNVDFSNAKKPEKLLKRIIELSTKPGDIVLDYHLGSGTTCAVAHKMSRQYIGIEQMDYIENITKKRLLEVIKGEKTGISKSVSWNGGGSFIYMELYKDSQIFLDRINKLKTDKQLLEFFEKNKNNEFLKYNIDFKEIDKKDFEKLDFLEKKAVLIELFDKNLLYKNYSEIDDEKSGVDKYDKKMNNLFYKNK